MKYADINKKYTEVISEYIAKGYIINTASMRGSQGEVAKIDLTDGNEIIRIRIESFYEGRASGYAIIVGKSTDRVEPNSNSFRTIWNDNLEVIEKNSFLLSN